jgi:hypothetical protein
MCFAHRLPMQSMFGPHEIAHWFSTVNAYEWCELMPAAQRQPQAASPTAQPTSHCMAALHVPPPRGGDPHTEASTHDAILLQSFAVRAQATLIGFVTHPDTQFASA